MGKKKKRRNKTSIPNCWRRGNTIANISVYITTQVITFHQAGPPVASLHLFSHSAVLFYPTMVFLVSKPLGFLERHCNLELDPKTLFLISIWQKFSEIWGHGRIRGCIWEVSRLWIQSVLFTGCDKLPILSFLHLSNGNHHGHLPHITVTASAMRMKLWTVKCLVWHRESAQSVNVMIGCQ